MLYDSIFDAKTCMETRRVVHDTALMLEDMGHDIIEISKPPLEKIADDFRLYWGMLAFALSKLGRIDPKFDTRQLDSLTKGLSSFYWKNIKSTPAMLYRLRRAQHDYTQMFNSYDMLLSPVTAHPAPRLGYLKPDLPFDELFERLSSFACFTPLQNAVGSPAISLPVGHSSEGIPIGVQLSTVCGGERMLLEMSFGLEEAKPWRKIQSVGQS